jgi:Tfp pilus assembly protein PilN
VIKVNLLPQRKAKRGSVDASSRHATLGVIALAAAAGLVLVAFDLPKRTRLSDLRAANDALQTQIQDKNKKLIGYAELKKAQEESVKRAESIQRLMSTKVVPAHVLHELSRVLTAQGPTMTETMAKLAGNGPGSDPNKRFQTDWEPTHVWILSFVDTNGTFKLDGGAQSESDVTQLSKRLAASVYFADVTPAGGERLVDADSGVNYYKFTITGKVAY